MKVLSTILKHKLTLLELVIMIITFGNNKLETIMIIRIVKSAENLLMLAWPRTKPGHDQKRCLEVRGIGVERAHPHRLVDLNAVANEVAVDSDSVALLLGRGIE